MQEDISLISADKKILNIKDVQVISIDKGIDNRDLVTFIYEGKEYKSYIIKFN